ncbi:hypothetical protein [Nocardia sp. NRRL S-836]|uniref:hypothetical protein n=1 Tax=Nocardia sp. NRRL S-836 TaxID=1519492 RepID=UPI0006AFA005|nr:hypothetical protein [Nocardia sp. NRRL S-836]KOV84744.1 hypothetical protein ADL03_15885 [Nocardia sp. NRRL S-836]
MISDDVAREIASWYQSPAVIDAPITALSHGVVFDNYALWERVSRAIDTGEFESGGKGTPRELRALQAWVERRMPRLVVVEHDLDARDWDNWVRQYGETGRERPDGIEPDDVEVSLVECAQRGLADWVYPGEASHPDKPTEHRGYDASDDSVQVPLSVVEAAAAMLSGTNTGFYAASYGGNPFSTALYWSQTDTFAEQGPGKPYASQYLRPTGSASIRLATLHGFTPEQEADVWKRWKGQS